MSTQTRFKSFFVWDLPTRAFHWLLFASVAVAYLTGGEDEGGQFTLHVAAGYLIAALLVFRIVWGFLGSEHSRFRDFIPTPARVKQHVQGLIAGKPKHYAGHNPVGGIAIFAMIAILVGTLYTGLFGGGEDLHETFANLILIVAGLHVVGVIAESLMTGENLVPAMVHGRKNLPEDAEDARESQPAGAGRVLASLAAVVIAAFAGISTGATPWPPTEAAFEGGEHGEQETKAPEGGGHEDEEAEEHEEYEDD
ncbi:MAG: cytochrome b/b6 domain-containing protein [Rhodovibrio sp.]|nr:cytochrome b/b6 domain-containing protein [Rhodovibrio sp.]